MSVTNKKTILTNEPNKIKPINVFSKRDNANN